MKRIFLYLATNLAIVLVLGITLRLLGFERILDEQGVGLGINGGPGGGLKRLFMTHPPLAERIAALRQAAATG
jgi:hypothetical protein